MYFTPLKYLEIVKEEIAEGIQTRRASEENVKVNHPTRVDELSSFNPGKDLKRLEEINEAQ